VFHAPYPHYYEFYSKFTGWNGFALEHMIFFFGGKFMFIFAFLFGYGCWMQYEKYTSHQAFQQFWQRRMNLLALFGILHILLLSVGDILLPYALLGMTLPWLLRWSNHSLIILAIVIHAIPVYEFILRHFIEFPSIFTQSDYALADYIRIHQEGSLWEIFQLRYYDYYAFQTEKWIIYIPKEWSLFMLGIVASRAKLIQQLSQSLAAKLLIPGLLVILFWYLFSGAVRGAFDLSEMPFMTLPLGIGILSIEFIHGAFYIIAISYLYQHTPVQKILKPLVYAGRLSLTIYLMQSFICMLLFHSYGLGWYGSLHPIQLLGLALLIYSLQVLFAYFWLQKHRYGPMEKLWRTYSYSKSTS
ncbi:MAG: DUF418 domain-containing protein, partial [Bacteroidota bacterium]